MSCMSMISVRLAGEQDFVDLTRTHVEFSVALERLT